MRGAYAGSIPAVHSYFIFNEDIRERKERIDFFQKSKNYELRFLQGATPAEVMVYKQTVCILLLLQDPLVIRIRNEKAAISFKQYFDTMWQLAKK